MKKLFYIFLIIPYFAFSQNINKDSIQRLVQNFPNTKTDTAAIKKIATLGYDLMEQDKLLSYQLIQEALKNSLIKNEANTISNCYRYMGLWYSNFSLNDSAYTCYQYAFKYAKSINNQFLMAGTLLNIGNVKYWFGQYDSCIHYYLEAAKIFEHPDFLKKNKSITIQQLDKRRSDLYSNLSQVFNTLHNLPKANEYIDKAISITQKYNSEAAKNALSFYMQIKADNYEQNKELEKSLRVRLQYLPQLERSSIELNYVQHAYQKISIAYLQLGKIDSSKLFAEKSYSLAKQIEAPSNIASASLQLATLAINDRNYKLAAQYLNEATPFYNESTDPAELSEYYNQMHELKHAQGDYKAAYQYLKKYQLIYDSVLVGEKSIEFAEREIRYETDKKNAQIKLQEAIINRNKLLNGLLIGGIVSLLIIGTLVYRNYNHRKKIQQQRILELETEKQLLATQSLLKGQEEERARVAKDLHDGLGGMLSGVKLQLGAMKGNLILSEANGIAFNKALNKLDESISEMRRVAHNMMPESLLNLGLQQALVDYCNSLSSGQTFKINTEFLGLENRLESSVEVVVYRIVQELVNNAVKHANAKLIVVQLLRQDNHLNITVEDDGKGMDKYEIRNAQTAGLQNIRSRVNYLKGNMHIDAEQGKGTAIYIECEIDSNG